MISVSLRSQHILVQKLGACFGLQWLNGCMTRIHGLLNEGLRAEDDFGASVTNRHKM